MFFVFCTVCLHRGLCGGDVRGCVRSYGNASSRTGQVTTSPVRAVTRPPGGEDADGGLSGMV